MSVCGLGAQAVARALARDLARVGRAEPEALAEWAVASVLGIRRSTLRAGLAPSPSPDELVELRRVAARLLAGEPLAYAVGYAEFCGRRFRVDRRVLIPRPETEELAAWVLQTALSERGPKDVWDIGTGSGVLAITFALERPTVRLTATDIDPAALAVAHENAWRHGVAERIRWRITDLLSEHETEVADVIVSNPPYVATADLAGLEPHVREFEPRTALDGGSDGLDVIRRLIPAAFRALRRGGRLYLEIGETHGHAVRTLLEQTGFDAIELIRDLAKRERFAVARRPYEHAQPFTT